MPFWARTVARRKSMDLRWKTSILRRHICAVEAVVWAARHRREGQAEPSQPEDGRCEYEEVAGLRGFPILIFRPGAERFNGRGTDVSKLKKIKNLLACSVILFVVGHLILPPRDTVDFNVFQSY